MTIVFIIWWPKNQFVEWCGSNENLNEFKNMSEERGGKTNRDNSLKRFSSKKMGVVAKRKAELSVHRTTHWITVSYQCEKNQNNYFEMILVFAPASMWTRYTGKKIKDFEYKKMILCLLFNEISMHNRICIQRFMLFLFKSRD